MRSFLIVLGRRVSKIAAPADNRVPRLPAILPTRLDSLERTAWARSRKGPCKLHNSFRDLAHPTRSLALSPHPQTSRPISTPSRTFAHRSSSVSTFPSSPQPHPHSTVPATSS